MKKLLFILFTTFCLFSNITYASNTEINKAFHTKQSNIQVQGVGIVLKVLKDDTQGSRHQRFLVKLASNLTILIAHNIDLSNKIENIQVGNTIEFYGEYEWNNKGGVVHWTHHDPRKKHEDGWLKYQGIIYQ
jgi:hypothetical protein